jgi:hypothetical protein
LIATTPNFDLDPTSLFMDLVQYLVDHKTLSTCCYVGRLCGIFIHLDIFDPGSLKVLEVYISSIQLCYAKCHNVIYLFLLQKLLILTNSIKLTMTERDTLRPLGIYTKYAI